MIYCNQSTGGDAEIQENNATQDGGVARKRRPRKDASVGGVLTERLLADLPLQQPLGGRSLPERRGVAVGLLAFARAGGGVGDVR